ncbi:MAG TPA: hypothetical protein VKA36_06230 [Solirubrobacterales bacterium]|nr:hypothetical protein [Solirubrobacterales bacterium]
MKLAALGAITAVLGAALGIDGLLLAGGFWVLMGLLLKVLQGRYRTRAEEARTRPAALEESEAEDGGAPGEASERPPIPFGVSFVVFLVLAGGSLAIGLGEIGFEEPDADWRWLPVAIGALAAFFVVVPGLMFATGSGMMAAVNAVAGDPQDPGRVTIEGSRETGTYINERPRLEFDLLVEPEAGEPWRVKKKATVPATAMGSIGIGDGFHALVDPEDHDAIAIDWQRPIAGSGGDGEDVGERLEELERLRDDGLVTDSEYVEQRRRILGSL